LRQPVPDFAGIGTFTFKKPDVKKFPCLSLAYQACENSGTFPAVLNAANEQAVDAFLHERISFDTIPEVISRVMESHSAISSPSLTDILEADRWARKQADDTIKGFQK